MQLDLENGELAFQDKLACVEHELPINELLEHEDVLLLNFNGELEYSNEDLNIKWDSDFDKLIGALVKHMTKLCKVKYSIGVVLDEHSVLEHVTTGGFKETQGSNKNKSLDEKEISSSNSNNED